MAATAQIIAAVAAVAGAGTGIASAVQGGPSAPKAPGLLPPQPPSRPQLQGDISTLAGRGLGGAAPAFFQGLQGPGGQGLDVLAQIREMTGGGAG